jgi:hypothetical protein
MNGAPALHPAQRIIRAMLNNHDGTWDRTDGKADQIFTELDRAGVFAAVLEAAATPRIAGAIEAAADEIADSLAEYLTEGLPGWSHAVLESAADHMQANFLVLHRSTLPESEAAATQPAETAMTQRQNLLEASEVIERCMKDPFLPSSSTGIRAAQIALALNAANLLRSHPTTGKVSK